MEGDARAARVAEALVREYLSRNRLGATLRSFDAERERTAESITNKNVLRKTLGLDRFALKVKKRTPGAEQTPPSLDLLVAQQLERQSASAEASHRRSPKQGRSSAATRPASAGPRGEGRKEMGLTIDPPGTTFFTISPKRPQVSEAGPAQPHLGPEGAEQRGLWGGEGDGAAPVKLETLMMEDVEEELAGLELAPVTIPKVLKIQAGASVGGGAALAGVKNLRSLVFGHYGGQNPESWKQGFIFNTRPGLQFGLVQTEGGPCGVLAAVQAEILSVALKDFRGLSTNCIGTLGGGEQRRLLVRALANTLWRAGGGSSAATIYSTKLSTAELNLDQLLESAKQRNHTSRSELEEALEAHLPQLMEPRGFGLVLFVLAVVQTKGVIRIENEMDETGSFLVAAHGYCTQELVNLLITGSAVSNVFDGQQRLEGGTRLQGIKRRSSVGLLTLFEWYKYMEVGTYLKDPEDPVWVVCSESHFSTLYASERREDWRPPFDLHYYDGLAQQEAPITLSLSDSPTGGHSAAAGDSFQGRGASEARAVPPLEYVIETKWAGVQVDWNGTEKIM